MSDTVWHMDLKYSPGSSGRGKPKAPSDVTLLLSDTDFLRLFEGKQHIKNRLTIFTTKFYIKGRCSSKSITDYSNKLLLQEV